MKNDSDLEQLENARSVIKTETETLWFRTTLLCMSFQMDKSML